LREREGGSELILTLPEGDLSNFSFGEAHFKTPPLFLIIGTFRSDYDNDNEYEFFNVYPVRMRETVTSTRSFFKISSLS